MRRQAMAFSFVVVSALGVVLEIRAEQDDGTVANAAQGTFEMDLEEPGRLPVELLDETTESTPLADEASELDIAVLADEATTKPAADIQLTAEWSNARKMQPVRSPNSNNKNDEEDDEVFSSSPLGPSQQQGESNGNRKPPAGSIQERLSTLRDALAPTQSPAPRRAPNAPYKPKPNSVVRSRTNSARGGQTANSQSQGRPTPADMPTPAPTPTPAAEPAPVATKAPSAKPKSLSSSRKPRDDSDKDETEKDSTPVVDKPLAAPRSVVASQSRTKKADASNKAEVSKKVDTNAKVDIAARASKPRIEQETIELEGPQLTASATGPRKIVIGRPAEFVVTVANAGRVKATEVTVSIGLPAGVELAGVTPTTGTTQPGEASDAGQPLVWNLAQLAPNAKENLKLQLVPRTNHPMNLALRWAHAGAETQLQVQEPLLEMTISGPNEIVFGESKIYNLTLSNPGTGDAENVKISLMPIEGKQDQPVSSMIGTLAKGETKSVQIELTAGKSGVLMVQAQATADGGLKADAVQEVLVRRAQLSVTAAGPDSHYAGHEARYEIKAGNAGTARADGVVLTANLPPGVELQSASHGGQLVKGESRVRWELGNLGPGEERKLELNCKLGMAGNNTLRVQMRDETELESEASVTTEVIARADLKLSVSDPSGPVPVGQEATFEVHILNRGTKNADGVDAVVYFSVGVEPISVQGAAHQIGEGQVTLRGLPSIAPGKELVVIVRAKADRPGDHVLRAEVGCPSLGTRLASEETTHFYGKEQIAAQVKAPPVRTAARPARAPAPLETPKKK